MGILDSGDNRLIGSRGGQSRQNDQLFSNNNLIRLGSEPMPNFGGPDQLLGMAARGSARGAGGAGLNRSEEQEMQHEDEDQDNEMRRMRTN